jgi:hypothetical protein
MSIVLFFFAAAGFFYGILAGKGKLISLLISFYVGGFLFSNFYYFNNLTKENNLFELFLLRIFVFFLIILALNILFSKILAVRSEKESKKWWQILLISVFLSGLLFSYIFHLFSGEKLFIFSPFLQNLFASKTAFFWWLILPLAAIFLTRK